MTLLPPARAGWGRAGHWPEPEPGPTVDHHPGALAEYDRSGDDYGQGWPSRRWLTAGDFTLTEDGVSQKIRYCEHQSLAVATALTMLPRSAARVSRTGVVFKSLADRYLGLETVLFMRRDQRY